MRKIKKKLGVRRGSKMPKWKKDMAKTMSKHQTWPEKILWKRLRAKQLGVNIYKQGLMYGWIVDFWCPKASLVIEADGGHHLEASQKKKDIHRDAVLKQKGIMTIRFTAKEIQKNTAAVVAIIKARIIQRMK